GLREEDAVAGAVEEVELVIAPGSVTGGQSDRNLAGDFFGVEVGDGVPVVDASETILGAAAVEQRARECRLAGVAVPRDRQVADSVRSGYLHPGSSGKLVEGGNITRDSRLAGARV